jgi:alpha-L-fucosidase
MEKPNLSYLINSTLIILLLILIAPSSYGQTTNQKELSWDELAAQYECPKWFSEGKFGIWCHWGPQSMPQSGGGWYARHMYMEDVKGETFGKNAYSYHLKTYGHPSEFGYKDVINQWKAEKFNADSLLYFFKANGAKFFVTTANHHDHFDLFKSTYHPWNSVNMGPKKDIVGEFEKATRKQKLPFGVTSHDNRFWTWWITAFGADKFGPKKGIPYDGYLTKADGKGKWWEGYDPADLYGPPPAKRTPELETKMKENYLKRHLELIDKYKPDYFYYDAYDFNYGDYGKQLTTHLYNNSLKKNGKIEAIQTIKRKMQGTVYDVEQGTCNTIQDKPWQSEISFGDWFYIEDSHRQHDARSITQMLSDVVSKNGTLLLNVELRSDGSIPKTQREVVAYVGDWLKINGEAIYGTKPWHIFRAGSGVQKEVKKGESIANAGAEAAAKAAEGEHYNARTIDSKPFASDEVRFTTKDKLLYVIVLDPKPGSLKVVPLGSGAPVNPISIKSVQILGLSAAVKFEQSVSELTVEIPEEINDIPNEFIQKLPLVLKISQ